ncbi:LOW QUALITY PROTEIN: uncharacterized protein LOC122131476 [Clupea harengus]|uniref:LOW QUALITY PROTEIN: uncharacterized protein LOC122131476 n=1 Tax=Clupea harengus TaxID=7950 RepID=A0A8M1KDK6_CLUHA|nr:LOW QUALITY PROTEIN: uncharacterized protein LOC122131476 [Clupea harengus]
MLTICASCRAPLEPEDGHMECPACLGVEHLRQGLTEFACMSCNCLSLTARAARLVEVETGTAQPHEGAHERVLRPTKRRSTARQTTVKAKRKKSGLAQKVDSVTTELESIKALLANLQPPTHTGQGGSVHARTPPADQAERSPPTLSPVGSAQELDTLSTRASESLDMGQGDEAESYESAPHDSQTSSQDTARGTGVEPEAGQLSIKSTLKAALARLGLDPVPVAVPPQNAFFRTAVQQTAFAVPPSAPYIEELQRCWADPRQFSHLPTNCRVLSAMQGASTYGLERMPNVEPSVAALILSPDEALRPHARCPRPQCRLTDDLIVRCYDAAARTARIGNSMSHLMLALTQTLQGTGDASASQGLCDSSLQAFAFMSRELVASQPAADTAVREVSPARQISPTPATRTLRPTQGAQATARYPSRDRRGEGAGSDSSTPAVGRFSSQHLRRWEAVTSDPWVLATLSQGYIIQFQGRPPKFRGVKTTTVTNPKALALRQEIGALLQKEAIEQLDAPTHEGGFYSTYFIIPKKDGGLRPILDLRHLNTHLKTLRFHMLRTKEVLHSIRKNDWFTTIDLKDAYFHVPIAPHHRQFLRFAFEGRAYQFRVLPFGIALAPRVFTRCVAAALAPLQAQGMRILPYLDDWLICSQSEVQARSDVAALMAHITGLGLRLNLRKSSLVPRQQTGFLGMAIDSQAMRAVPSQQRVDGIQQLVARFRGHRALTLRSFQRLLGMLTSAASLIPLGLLALRPFQIWLNSLGLHHVRHRHRLVRVTTSCRRFLHPWRRRKYLTQGVPLGAIPSRREVVTTDASQIGWGAVWQRQTARGRWSPQQKRQHINVLELRAVLLALRHFLPALVGRHVLVRSDNMSAVYYINHQGGTRSLQCLGVAQQLLQETHQHLLSLRAVYLPGTYN